MREGVLPGGGVAYLMCMPLMQERLDLSTDADEKAAHRIILHALEAPLRTLLVNAGYEPGAIMGKLKSLEPGNGFNVVTGEVVNMHDAGILDIATVVKAAVLNGVGGAAMALTTDVVVHRAKAPESFET
jgi:chaperonin GroEL